MSRICVVRAIATIALWPCIGCDTGRRDLATIESGEKGVSLQHEARKPDDVVASEMESVARLEAIGAELVFDEKGRVISIDISENDTLDKDLPSLAVFTELRSFFAVYTRIKGECLAGLSQTPSLTRLDLFASPIGDVHIVSMKQAKSLRYVNLAGTSVTDESIPTILSWPELEVLEIGDTQISSGGLEMLKARLEDCDVVF